MYRSGWIAPCIIKGSSKRISVINYKLPSLNHQYPFDSKPRRFGCIGGERKIPPPARNTTTIVQLVAKNALLFSLHITTGQSESIVPRATKSILFIDMCQKPCGGGSADRKDSTYRRQQKREHTSLPQAEFELTIQVFEWQKTVEAMEFTTTVINSILLLTAMFNPR